MNHSFGVAAGLLALAVAGCSTSNRHGASRLPDWQHASSSSVPVRSHTNWTSSAPVTSPIASPAISSVPTNSPTDIWIPVARWCATQGLAAPMRITSTVPASYALQTPAGNFIFRPGSQRAFWNGFEVNLGYAPQVLNNQPCLHVLDLKKTVQPLVLHSSEKLKSFPIVVLDPGHGGLDCGTQSVLGGACEKQFTLDWAVRIRDILASHGWVAMLTRHTDVDLGLSNRVQIAEQFNADLFISLHFNASPDDQRQEGIETYCLTPVGVPSNLTRGFSDNSKTIFPNNAYDDQNVILAARVHRAMLQVNRNDRGIRRARFLSVLQSQQRPAILIEGGYLSNPREAKLIADGAYRQKLAEAVAHSLIQSAASPAGVPSVAADSSRTNSGVTAPN